ncbi:MAG TPA: amino acid permease [Bacteroidia bacterium]|nr:amino acid permease [Bacteroidia bacterium]
MLFDKLLRKKPVQAIRGDEEDIHGHGLHRVLTTRDLTFFGIAAIIGAGIFSSIGSACASGGPAVIFLFLICAVACGFTALCYAEFASRVPMSGSAYTYAYVSFGELFAWIIGWALLMEYSIGNIYVAFSWSGYFTNLLEAFHLYLPAWLTANYSESHLAFLNASAFASDYASHLAGMTVPTTTAFSDWFNSEEVQTAIYKGGSLNELYGEKMAAITSTEEYRSWTTAPVLGGLKTIFDLPAVLINIIVTLLVLIGVKESKNVSNLMVIIKLAIIVLIIFVGIFYIDIDNWTPFMPNGFSGVMAGVASVFFAFIGFDAVSTLAEECKNPQRDLPRGMIYSLLISTIIFVLLVLVLTGMASYASLDTEDPLAEIFRMKGVKWMLYLVSISAVVAMTSVILVFQMGQPRIWMTMSRDGLMPQRFGKIHPKFKTPAFATVVTGLVVGIPIFFTNRDFILDFTSIGTLFAFTLVCGGVLVLPKRVDDTKGKFKLPYINAKFIVPGIVAVTFATLLLFNRSFLAELFDINEKNAAANIPMLFFLLLCIFMSIMSWLRNYSLIPVLGFLSCLYLFTGFSISNWMYFFAWLMIGLLVYFMYGFRKSKLNTAKA